MPSLNNIPPLLRLFSLFLIPTTVASAQHADGEYLPAEASKVSFGPSVAIAIGVFSFMLSLTVVLLAYVKCRRSASLDRFSPEPASDRRPQHQSSGVGRTVVESLPFFRFSSLCGVRDGLECAVCLSKFDGDEILRLLPRCQHTFHIDCVDRWLEAHSSCPLCRCKVNAGDAAHFAHSTSSRFLFASNRHENSGRELELFVEREPNYGTGSSRFGFGNSSRKMDKNTKEKENLPMLEEANTGDQFFHKFKHRIIVSDVLFKGRWSALNSSDLATLDSNMLNFTPSERFAVLDLKVETTGLAKSSSRALEGKTFVDDDKFAFVNCREKMERGLAEIKVNQIDGLTWSANLDITTSRASICSGNNRSMSEITNMSRLSQERDRGNSTVSGDKDERLWRIWLPIARRTVQCFAGRDHRVSTAAESPNV